MAAVSHHRRFVYFPIPKNATSSMKLVMYEIDTGVPFTEEIRKELRIRDVHKLYPSSGFRKPWLRYYSAYTSIAIVRDPIKRFISAYRNRVVHTKVLEEKPAIAVALSREKLNLTPSLNELVENLDRYRAISHKVHAHTVPQSGYLGKFWKKINHRIPIERLNDVPQIVKATTGQDIVLKHEQTGGPKVSIDELSKANFDKLANFYRADYRMLKAFYSPDK
jgi:hypothetical protein